MYIVRNITQAAAKLFLIISCLLFSLYGKSQCPRIDIAMINSCAPSATGTEGTNEFLVFTTTAAANANAYKFYLGTNSTPATGGANYTMFGEDARTKNGTGSIVASGCNIITVTSGSTPIPSGAKVIFIPSDFEQAYDLSVLCNGSTMYVVYIDRDGSNPGWQEGGSFGNNPGTSFRYLQLTNGANTCSAGIRRYNSSWPGGDRDGNFVSWDAAGTATYGNNGCDFNPIPTITPQAIPAICKGTTSASLAFTTTNSPDKYSITWNAAALAAGLINSTNINLPSSSISISVPAGIAAGTYTATIVVSNSVTFSSSTAQTIMVTVNDKPVVAAVTGTTTVCKSSTVQLASAPTGGVWTTSDASKATVSSGGLVTAVAEGSAIISYAVTNTCGTNSQPKTVTIIDKPIVPGITGTNTICVNATTQLSNATLGGTWSSGDIFKATVSTTGLVTGVAAGSPVITYTVSNSCGSTPVTYTVTINSSTTALPPITAPDNKVCVNATLALSNTTTGGTWSSSDITKATINTNGVVTGVAAGTATISYSFTGSCGTTSSTYVITINDKPAVASISGNNNLCVNAVTQLANATLNGVWASSDITKATISNNGLVAGVAAGTATISYTVTNSCGTTTAPPQVITINDKPVVPSITGTGTVCTAATTQLSNTVAGGVWASSDITKATVSNNGLVTGVATGTAIISYAVSNSCGNTPVTSTVTITAKPVVAAITGTSTICANATTQLANTTALGIWSSSDVTKATVNSTGLVTGVAAGTSTISYAVTNGCGTTTVNYTVTVDLLPALVVRPDTTICAGSSVILSATTDATSTIVWTGAGAGNPVTVTPAATTAYTVTATSNKGCIRNGTVNITVQNFSVTLAASPNPVVRGTSLALSTSSALPYQVTAWQPAALFSNQTATTQSLKADSTRQYTVTAKTTAGCTATASVNVIVTSEEFDLFIPNYFTPNNDGKNDMFRVFGTAVTALEMRVYNQWGQLVFESRNQANGWDGSGKGKQQPAGVYIYIVKATLQNNTIVDKKGSVTLIR